MEKKQLCVASVICSGRKVVTPVKEWFNLQQQFLIKTTDKFDHVFCLSGDIDQSLFPKILDASPEISSAQYVTHINIILDYFQSVRDIYENFLILDSDAFPIRHGWLPLLRSKMKEKNKYYACPIRCENLDTFPHLCVFFAPSDTFNRANFHVGDWHLVNLMGIPFRDVGLHADDVYVDKKHVMMPLIRTNVYNPHQVHSAIYSNLFYHHGGGSRKKGFRSDKLHIVKSASESSLVDKLFANPESYINKLIGVKPIFL